MPQSTTNLRRLLGEGGDSSGRSIHGLRSSVTLAAISQGTGLGGRLHELAGATVLLVTAEQLSAGLALIELDGIARRVVLCPPICNPST